MTIKELSALFGVLFTLVGSGVVADYQFTKDIKIGKRMITKAEYAQIRSDVLASYDDNNNYYLWTHKGGEFMDVLNIELKNCIKQKIKYDKVSIKKNINENSIKNIKNLIQNKCI